MAAVPVVLALVPERRCARLAAALRPEFDVLWLGPGDDPLTEAPLRPAAVVLDPTVLAQRRELVEPAVRQLVRSVPIVIYTDLTLDAMHRLFDLRHLPSASLVFADLEDGPAALRHAVARAGDAAHRMRAAEALRSAVGPLPDAIAEALVRLLTVPGGDLTVQRLAGIMNVSSRTLERRLAASGSPPAGRLVRTGRALLARELLRSSRLTATEVARDVGYAKLDSLRALTRWSFGSSPSSLRARQHTTADVDRGVGGG